MQTTAPRCHFLPFALLRLQVTGEGLSVSQCVRTLNSLALLHYAVFLISARCQDSQKCFSTSCSRWLHVCADVGGRLFLAALPLVGSRLGQARCARGPYLEKTAACLLICSHMPHNEFPGSHCMSLRPQCSEPHRDQLLTV